MPSVILKGHKEGYEFILKDVSSFNEIKKEFKMRKLQRVTS